MDDFREWLSDNLRYFMLGFGILAVVLILFFGVRFISSKFGNQKTTEPKQETQQETETPTPTQEAEETPATTAEPETTPAAGELELNAYPQVNALIEKYYAALTGKDVQSLKELVDELDPSDESAITNSQYIEGYSNVQVYTKKGMTDTSYVVFAAYDHKYVGYDTLLPGISYLYVDTKEDGSLYIVADPNEEQLEDAKVQEMLNSTQASYDEKLASDEALSKYLSELGVEGSAAMEAAEGAQITVKSNCNIRKEPSQDAESIGKLVGGQTVTKTGEDGDWIKIEFEGQTGYVRGDMFQ